jgi:hypothetical protein
MLGFRANQEQIKVHQDNGRMARGGRGLPKVSPGLTVPNLSTLYGQATPERALRPF